MSEGRRTLQAVSAKCIRVYGQVAQPVQLMRAAAPGLWIDRRLPIQHSALKWRIFLNTHSLRILSPLAGSVWDKIQDSDPKEVLRQKYHNLT